jgi:hypothetical protein
VNRIEIEIKLNRGRAEMLEAIASMTEEDIRRPRTQSQHDADTWWSYADHFIHTTLIESNFNSMIRRHVSGKPGMDRNLVDPSGAALRSMEDIMAYVNEMTEKWKIENQDKSVDELVRIGQETRSDTLVLLSELDDDQLASKIPGAPWADGTVGGIMAVHADHAVMHRRYAVEGEGPR